MQRLMLKSKIHRATVTGTALHYEGSITIDKDLLDRAEILPGEQVHVLNCSNGERFVTYAIAAVAGSGTILLNGPAARLGYEGDKVVILTYALAGPDEIGDWHPTVVLVDDENQPREK